MSASYADALSWSMLNLATPLSLANAFRPEALRHNLSIVLPFSVLSCGEFANSPCCGWIRPELNGSSFYP